MGRTRHNPPKVECGSFWKRLRTVRGHRGFEPSESAYTAPGAMTTAPEPVSVLLCGAGYMYVKEELIQGHPGAEGPRAQPPAPPSSLPLAHREEEEALQLRKRPLPWH